MRPEITVCAHTGLALVPAGRQPTYRLAKPSYGAVNPPTRGLSSSEDRFGWNRFDLPGEQTIYCASSPEGAYGELLGALKVSGPYRVSEYLDDPGEDDLYALIAQDWAELGARPPGVIDISWLYAHRMYTVRMPPSGWFIEIEHARSLTYLGAHIPLPLWEARGHRDHRGADAQRRPVPDDRVGRSPGHSPACWRGAVLGYSLLLQAWNRMVMLGGVVARRRRRCARSG